MRQRLTEMSNGAISGMYRANKMYDSPASVAKHGTVVNLHTAVGHNGSQIAMRAKTVAPVAEYDEWLKNGNYRWNTGPHLKVKNGAKLRRIVIMRRQGSSWKECGDAVGVTGSAAKDWVEFLPLHLAI